ncbi:MAG: type II toxin-antitoxin system RelE/ParE family toxin [Candidatus Aminicenantes bacterium]|nr:type II toxin-antitoxin system RelE/ParE family toxin [Candidatus Aminicenantes bacterium]
MEVIFRTNKLQKCYESYQRGCRAWGPEVARKYIQRIELLQEAFDMVEIGKLPGLNCHPLKGRREGQYGITIHGRWRLIFSLKGERAEVLCVEEVSKHYGD